VIRETAPDLVVLQEATDPRVVEWLSKETGLRVWAARPGQSLAFLSRIDIAHHEWHRPRGARHPFLEIVLAGTEFRVFGLHLRAVHSSWTERGRMREVRALLAGIERHREGFHVLVGDFNTLAPGELLDVRLLPARLRAIAWLGGDIQWETIQILLNWNYVDGYRRLYPLEKGYTFPTWAPHVRLDYIFLPAVFADRLNECEVVSRISGDVDVAQASDHFPLLAEVEVSSGF
jgi:exodeoxyribonuclease III